MDSLATQPNLAGEPKVPVRDPSSKVKAEAGEIVQWVRNLPHKGKALTQHSRTY